MKEEKETKKILKDMTQFVVIGLGRFGKSVATSLAELGKEVLVIDNSAEDIHQMENIVSSAVVADATANNVLQSLGVQNFDCVINCIGDDLQSSIMTTLICKDLGVNYILAKAQNEKHKKVLERIGADMVIIPEVNMGQKVAQMLVNPNMNIVTNLTSKFKIAEILMPDEWQEKSIMDLNIRKKYQVSIIFIKRENEVINPTPETILNKGDILILAGELIKLKNLSKKVVENININNSLKNALL